MNNHLNESITWSPGISLEEIEKQVLLRAYRFFRSNKQATANSLKISVRTLDRKLEEYENQQKIFLEKQARVEADRQAFLARSRGQLPDNYYTGAVASQPVQSPIANSEDKKK